MTDHTIPTDLLALNQILESRGEILLPILVDWGLIKETKTCDGCHSRFPIDKTNKSHPNPPLLRSKYGRCLVCVNTLRYLDTGSILDQRNSKLSIKAKVFMDLYTVRCGNNRKVRFGDGKI